MKRLLTTAIALAFFAILLFGCSSEAMIEKTIGEFETAVNDDSVGDLKDTLSPDSDFYITQTFQGFLDYFDGQRNVNYPDLSITVDGSDGDALSDATYVNGTFPVSVQFVMRKEKGFFSFLAPSWKILQYWDEASGTMENIWRRLQIKAQQQE